MSRILKLVKHIAAKVGYVPAHAEGSQRTQYTTGVEFPGVIRVVKIAIRGEIVVRDHGTHIFLLI